MTDFVEVKTSELTGGGLNWAVAKAEGYEPMLFPHSRNEYGVVASLGRLAETVRRKIDAGQIRIDQAADMAVGVV